MKNLKIAVLLTVMLLSSLLINAQTNCVNFTMSQDDIGISSETFGVSLADFDGDGWKDVVTIDAYDKIEVYFNNGDGTFNITPTVLGEDYWRFGVEVIDIENDGDWDFITSPFSTSSGNGMEIWENNGTGNFTLKGTMVNNSSGYEFAVGDLNGDGYTDVFFPHGDISIMLNDGTGNFVSNGQSFYVSSPEDVTLADFDADNDLDAVVVRGGGVGFVGKYFINDGTGQFMDSGQELSRGNAEGVDAGDIDADGDLDIAIAPWMGEVHFWINDGLGNFMPGDTLFEVDWFFNDIILEDINFDGNVDVLTDKNIWLNDHNNPGSFILQDFEMSASNHGFELADINNDNLWDIYLGRFSSDNGDLVYFADQPTYINIDTTICFGDSLFLQGGWQTLPGTYLDFGGCDTLTNIALSFYDEINTEVTLENGTLTATTGGAEYQWLDCDDNFSPIEGETAQSFTPTVSGNYAVEITENGTCVDTSACYTVSHFNFEGGDPSNPLWTIYIGSAMLEDVDLVAGDEIAIFDGDIMVGVFVLDQICTPENQFDNDLTAFSELFSQSGYQAGNAYSFKCWDASEELEIESFDIELFNPYGDAYTEDVFPAGDGEYSIVALDFLSSASQTFNLSYGFQFISSGVNPTDPDILVVMADVLNDNLDFARNSLGQTLRKIGPNWVNGIGDWIVDEGYLVKMFAEDSFSINGVLVEPATPISVETGFQFVSYFPETPMDALIAFGTIIGDDLDFIRNSQGQTLRKIGPNWVNGIGDCMPGEGYLVKMYADGEIIYPTTAKSSGMFKINPSHLIFEGGNAADPVYTIYVEGLAIGDEVAAYDGNVMVGSTVIVSVNTLENALPIFSTLTSQKGYVDGNNIILKVWDDQLQSQVSSTYTFVDEYEEAYFESNYPSEDGEFSVINITKGASDNIDVEANVSIYPNPASDVLNVVANTNIKRVRIINFIGQIMFDNNVNNSSININTSAYQSGVYIISVETSNGVITEKITIK